MSGIRRIPYSRAEFFKVSDYLLDRHHNGKPLRYTVVVDGLEVVGETYDPMLLEEARHWAEERAGTRVILITIKGNGRSVQKTVFFIPGNLSPAERKSYLGDDPELMAAERKVLVEREEKRIEQELTLRNLQRDLRKQEEEYGKLEAYCLHLEDVVSRVKSELGQKGGKDVEGLLVALLAGAVNPEPKAPEAAKEAQAPTSEEEMKWALLGTEARQRLDAMAYEALLLFIAGCIQSPGKAGKAIKEGSARLVRKIRGGK
jgi:hypothetical protein